MIGVPNKAGEKTIEVELPGDWSAGPIAQYRTADVGVPVLTEVAVLSAHEAASINATYKLKAEETLRSNLEAKGRGYLCQHLDEVAVHQAAEIEKLLAAIKQDGFGSSWVVIEEYTYD